MGFAKIKYGDGSWYEGNLKEGEKDGKGHFKSMFEEYEGEYVGNKKEGRGVYKTRTVEIDGNFKNNKADGKGVMRKFNYLYDG